MAILHTSWVKKSKVSKPIKKEKINKPQLPKYKVVVKKSLPEDSGIQE